MKIAIVSFIQAPPKATGAVDFASELAKKLGAPQVKPPADESDSNEEFEDQPKPKSMSNF